MEEHAEATNLYGYRGDKREQKAEIIIRRKHVGSSSNDIGFVQTEDGSWSAIISEYDSNRYNGGWLDKLTQTYAREVIQEVAEEQGFTFESTESDGEMYVTCERSY